MFLPERPRQGITVICMFAVIFVSILKKGDSQCVYTRPADGKLHIQESDTSQSIIFPITGRIGETIDIQGNTVDDQTVISDNQIQFAWDGTQNLMFIGKTMDRDGPTAAQTDDIDVFEFTISCTYQGPLGETTVFHDITVQIDDVNDNTPQFTQLSYSTTKSEALVVGTTIYNQLQATDKDANLNKRLVYSIEAGADYKGSPAFEIKPLTGVIVLTQKIDYEYLKPRNEETFTLDIKVTMCFSGNHESYGITNIELITEPREVSIWHPHRLFSSGEAKEGAPQEKPPAVFGCPKYYPSKAPTYKVSAEPARLRKSNSTSLAITITDEDDLPPSFTFSGCRNDRPEYDVNCNNVFYVTRIVSGIVDTKPLNLYAEVNGIVGITSVALEAVDLDYLNDQVNFVISGSSPALARNYFTISTLPPETRGERTYRRAQLIQSNTPYLRADSQNIELYLQAQQPTADGDVKIAEAMVKILVDGSNQNPPVVTVSSFGNGYIYENTPAGTNVFIETKPPHTIMMLVVTDPDLIQGETQEYNFEVLPVGTPFAVHIEGNVAFISNTRVLDFESQSLWQFTVRVTEQLQSGARSTDQSVRVTVIDKNDNAPVFTSTNYRAAIAQGYYVPANRTLLAEVRATDADSGPRGIISYSIQEVSVVSGLLTERQVLDRLVLESSGNLYFSNGNALTGLSFVVVIKATDGGDSSVTLASTTTVTVRVQDGTGTNTPPVFRYLTREVVSESAPGQSFVLEVFATEHQSSTLRYEFAGGDSGNFAIPNSNSGIIVVSGPATESTLNYELKQQHVFQIKATDGDGLSALMSVTVNVLNANDNSPRFNQTVYNFFVDEGLPANTFVGTVFGSDADGDLVQFSWETSVFDFVINTNGVISTTRALNYETHKSYEFTVFINDVSNDQTQPSRQGSARVIVFVRDIDDNNPRFSPTTYSNSFFENVPIGTSILKVTATDADATPIITYQMTGTNNDFSIDLSGVIRTNRLFKWENELTKHFTFQVTTAQSASETSIQASRANVTINLLSKCAMEPTSAVPGLTADRILQLLLLMKFIWCFGTSIL